MPQTVPIAVLAGLALSAIALAGLLVYIYREARRIFALDRRLSLPRRQALDMGLSPRRRARRGPGARGEIREFGLALVKAGSILAPVGAAEREKLARTLRMAGFGDPDALSLFLSLKLGVALACGTAAALWATGHETLAENALLVALAGLTGLVIGSIIPEYALRALAARRTQNMATALPDALDLTVMCLESGLTFERALVTVSEELRPIESSLAGELRMMEAELRVGSDRRMVLQEFLRRTEVEGLRDLAMTLIQSERFGTPLTQSMKNIAAGERTQRALRIATRAERLPVLLTMPMLIFVVPGTMALVAGPAFLTAMKSLGSIGG